MKKGSLVELREDFFSSAEEVHMLSSLGYPLLLHNTTYMLSCDEIDYTCSICGKIHGSIELEEFPGLAFNSSHFELVLASQEVEIKALLDA